MTATVSACVMVAHSRFFLMCYVGLSSDLRIVLCIPKAVSFHSQ